MIKKRKPYKTYTKEFKLEAVRLMEVWERTVDSNEYRSE